MKVQIYENFNGNNMPKAPYRLSTPISYPSSAVTQHKGKSDQAI